MFFVQPKGATTNTTDESQRYLQEIHQLVTRVDDEGALDHTTAQLATPNIDRSPHASAATRGAKFLSCRVHKGIAVHSCREK